ncbi:hypothetical protein GCM10020358_58110 [Amorphoplanes nipponensis]|uniref:Uncharacterized protein n=1 Tax=Actinoplanes nipponensis TaxID=135950 RepID=A0A919JK79_9ACTN|nr:hypothetical protein [Actinoplanes nipponensis]GIE52514.1 hypothetical protein Ani05nite_60480 [Actinoplanes nipponensis]
MTDTTAEPGAFTPTGPEPRLRDLVRVRFVLEDHQEHPGVVIDILRRPSIPHGDRYRVRFRDGITDWHFRDELTVVPFTAQAEIVRTDLGAIRTIFDHAITAARDHDLLHHALGEVFDALTAAANTYLGGPVDTLSPAATPAD